MLKIRGFWFPHPASIRDCDGAGLFAVTTLALARRIRTERRAVFLSARTGNPKLRRRCLANGSTSIKGLEKAYGAFKAVDGIDLTIPQGSFVSLLGPSGCGKTTTLRMIAGFVQPTKGEIRVDGEVFSSPAGTTPPERRSMGMVFQSYAVWPHMTVFENIAYGLRHGKKTTPKDQLHAKGTEIISLVGLAGQEGNPPNALSGGQQQRVALARALITEPRILLLDEPLSNLDAKLRESMRFELRRLQKRLGITTVFVTHSQEEALLLSDFVVVMRGGRIVAQDTPERLYREPQSKFVADFVGTANFIEGKTGPTNDELCSVTTPDGSIDCINVIDSQAGQHALVMVRPQDIRLTARNSSKIANGFDAVVTDTHFNGSVIDYILELQSGHTLRSQTFAPAVFKAGDEVCVHFDRERCRLVRNVYIALRAEERGLRQNYPKTRQAHETARSRDVGHGGVERRECSASGLLARR